jgi:hypothetical protein
LFEDVEARFSYISKRGKEKRRFSTIVNIVSKRIGEISVYLYGISKLGGKLYYQHEFQTSPLQSRLQEPGFADVTTPTFNRRREPVKPLQNINTEILQKSRDARLFRLGRPITNVFDNL